MGGCVRACGTGAETPNSELASVFVRGALLWEAMVRGALLSEAFCIRRLAIQIQKRSLWEALHSEVFRKLYLRVSGALHSEALHSEAPLSEAYIIAKLCTGTHFSFSSMCVAAF